MSEEERQSLISAYKSAIRRGDYGKPAEDALAKLKAAGEEQTVTDLLDWMCNLPM